MIETGKATLHECQTVYSVQDVYEMLEIAVVSSHNRRTAQEWDAKNRGR